MSSSPAELSIIMITPDNYETIQKAIGYLRKQTVLKKLEIVVVAPDMAALEADYAELEDFLQYRIVELGAIKSLGQAKAAGIREACAPVIAFVEEHVYTDPGWAEALIKAHQHEWAAVGPVVRNADPGSLFSWADFIITYGQWMEPLTAGVVNILPGHNSSYKRDLLLAYGESLELMLEVEAIMHQDLQEKGYSVFLEPNAVIYHLGFSRLIPSLPVQFHIGRLFAADRVKGWSFFKRLFYTCGSPLIPAVRFFRMLHKLIRTNTQHSVPYASLPFTAPGLIVSAMGEMAGYALGVGDSKRKMLLYEFHRVQQR